MTAVDAVPGSDYLLNMERIRNKAPFFEGAARWEREQMWAMTP